jgi:hypothetical protein
MVKMALGQVFTPSASVFLRPQLSTVDYVDEVASSSVSDVDRYVIVRKLLYSIFLILQSISSWHSA